MLENYSHEPIEFAALVISVNVLVFHLDTHTPLHRVALWNAQAIFNVDHSLLRPADDPWIDDHGHVAGDISHHGRTDLLGEVAEVAGDHEHAIR